MHRGGSGSGGSALQKHPTNLGQAYKCRRNPHTHKSSMEGKLPRSSQAAEKPPARPRPFSARIRKLGKPRAQLSGSRPAASSVGGMVAAVAAAAGPDAAPSAKLGSGAAITSLVSRRKPWDQLAGSGSATGAWIVRACSAGNTSGWPQRGGRRRGASWCAACNSSTCKAGSAPASTGGSGSGAVNPSASKNNLQGQRRVASGNHSGRAAATRSNGGCACTHSVSQSSAATVQLSHTV